MERESSPRHVTLFLAGDVMTGRGVDQILARPGDPTLHESVVRDARRYVELAERANGPIPRRVAPDYVWGDALTELERRRPDVRIVNLETAVTHQGAPWPGKGIHYRMHPANLACLAAAGVDCWNLANNHVLDWSYEGLDQTLEVLARAGIATAGAGRDEHEAWSPTVLRVPDGPSVVVMGVAAVSSGVPTAWAASVDRPGVALLRNLSGGDVDEVARRVAATARTGDLVVASIHWGGNWGYHIPAGHRSFAHELIDRAGVHVVHGHSSHHPLGIEVYRGRPVLYGCGDLVTDYEGITGQHAYRGDLGLMFFVTMDPGDGRLVRLELVPTRVRRFRVTRASPGEATWLAAVLDRESASMGCRIEATSAGVLRVHW